MMKHLLLAFAVLLGGTASAQIQYERIWRCGGQYTNQTAYALEHGCKEMETSAQPPPSTPPRGARPAPASLTIPVSPDGHFRMRGTVNGMPALFLVDSGASLVSVSSAFARRAGLQGGTPTTFRTANGRIEGRVISGIDVMASTMYVTGVDIVVGMGDEDQVLLGQSFLRYFEITMDAKQMVMKYKGQ